MGDVVRVARNVSREVGKFFSTDLGRAIGVAAAVVGAVVGGPIGFALMTAAVLGNLAAGYYQQQKMKKALERLKQGTQGILANTRTANIPLPIVYGEARVGGNIIFLHTEGNNNNTLYMVMSLSEGEIEIGNEMLIYFNEAPIIEYTYAVKKESEWRLVVYGGAYTHVRVYVKWKDAVDTGYSTSWVDRSQTVMLTKGGSASISNTTISLSWNASTNHIIVSAGDTNSDRLTRVVISEFSRDNGSTWERNRYSDNVEFFIDRGDGSGIGNRAVKTYVDGTLKFKRPKGVALLYIKLIYNQKIFQGVPNITVALKGRRIKDTRDGVVKFTSNPALVLYDFLTNTRYGFGIDPSRLDTQSFNDVANYCDRYGLVYDGVITDGRGIDIVEHILDHFKGYLVYSQGKFYLKRKHLRYEPTVATITDDDIIAGSLTISMPSVTDMPNAVRVHFINPELDWRVDTILVEDTSVSTTEERQVIDVPLYGANRAQALWLGTYILERTRLSHAISFTVSPEYFNLELGDIIQVKYDAYGINAKYRIESMSPTSEGMCRIEAVLEDNRLYDYDVNLDIYEIDLTDVPDPNRPVVFSQGEVQLSEVLAKGEDDRLHSWLRVSFPEKPFCEQYELWLKKSDWTEWRNYGTHASSPILIPDLVEDVYQVKLVPITIFGVKDFGTSPIETITILGKYYPPPDVQTFSITPQPYGDLLLEWSPVDDLDLVGYEVRLGSTWDAGEVIVTNHSSSSLVYDASGKSGTLTFHVKAIDSVGNYSQNPNTQSITISPPNAVQNLRAEVIDNNVLLRFDAPAQTTFAIEAYEVRKGSDWSTAEVLGTIQGTFHVIFEQKSGEYTYWVSAVDFAGNYGPPSSVVASVSEPPDFVLHSNPSFTWGGTRVNAEKDTSGVGGLLIPIPQETWDQHFTNHGMSTIQDFINAGYTYWIEPSSSIGSYEEQFDLGGVIGSAKITIQLNSQKYGSGTSSITPTISISQNGTTWTDYANKWSIYATNFRYVKVKLDVSVGNDKTFYNFKDGSSVKLELRRKTDEGQATITDANTGVTVYFTVSFVDVESITVTPQGSSSALIPVVDFADVPNPTSFTVYLFDANGNRTTGSFYWIARGV